MTRESPTRRRVLASLAGIGALSSVAGAGTVAFLDDREAFWGRAGAGSLGVTVDCEDCEATESGVAFALAGIEPGATGRTSFAVTVADNPARLWLATDCPAPVDALADTLEVTLWVEADCDERVDTTDTVLYEGTLRGLLTAFASGRRVVDGECVEPDTPLCLGLAWELPADATWLADAESPLVFRFGAEQCRHVTEAEAVSPFPAADCWPPMDCTNAVRLGKADTGSQLAPGDVLALDAEGDFADDGHDYALEVLTVTDKGGDGERETVCAAVRLLVDGAEPDDMAIRDVHVGGGPPAFAGGGKPNSPGGPDRRAGPPNTVTHRVSPPTTRTRGQVCAVRDKENPDPEAEPHGERPAISNIAVSVCAAGDGEVSRDA